MMLFHEESCLCELCRNVRHRAHVPEQSDHDTLADAWERWISSNDGEARKLRAGENGAPGSPRWTALQAIAATRVRSRT